MNRQHDLANRLMNAESIEAFVRETGGAVSWETVASIKSEVDRLVGSDLTAASALAGRAEELAAVVGDSVSRAFAQAGRARTLHISGRHVEANTLYSSAVSSMRAASLMREAAGIQKQQVDALTQMGCYEEALRKANAARKVLAGRDSIQTAQLEANVGNIYYRMDRYQKALSHYDRALQMIAVEGDEITRALVEGNRSNVLIEMDRHDEALQLLEQTALVCERNGQALFAAEAHFHIAYLHYLRGHYNVALTSYYQVRDRLAALGDSVRVAWCNQDIAEILLALNAYDDSIQSASAAREHFTGLGLPYESAQATLVRGLGHMGLREFEKALTDLTETREVFAGSSNRTLVALVDAYLAELSIRREDYNEATNRARAALRVFARQKLATRSAYARLLQARAAYSAGDLTRASRIVRAALASVERLFAPTVVYQCHHLLGRIERSRNRNQLALNSFRQAVETVERMRGGIAADEFKASFLQDKIEAYEDAIAACLDEGSEELVEEAFRLLESSKSRALADLLARYVRGAQETTRPNIKSETRSRLLSLIQDLNWHSSQAGLEGDKGDQRSAEKSGRYRDAVLRYERQIANLFRSLQGEHSDFAEIHQMPATSAPDLGRSLEPGETVIEYFTTGDRLSAFIACRDGIKVIRGVASKSQVERMLAALRFQIDKFNYGPDYVEAHFSQLSRATNEHLIELYKTIFLPIERMLDAERLIIVPHGVLHYLPFHALYNGTEYLAERFEISYAPSASVFTLCRARSNGDRRPRGSATMVALGLAESGTPNIEEEVQTLASLFPRAVKLTGDKATRDNLMRLAPRARFLHLASHGYFRRDNPMFSFLKLADSHLNFYSLLDMKLAAELVTLSACHTGVNMVFPGDELHGLMRGFLYAGAPSVVASLWAVSDRSTAEFMREMYSHIRAGADKRTALRRAQLAIKDTYGHPYYWAPFVLMGNPT